MFKEVWISWKFAKDPPGKSRRNGGLKPFKDLHVEELKRECTVRGLSCDGSKKELQEILKE